MTLGKKMHSLKHDVACTQIKVKRITSTKDDKGCCPKASINPQNNNPRNGNYQTCKGEPEKNSHQNRYDLEITKIQTIP